MQILVCSSLFLVLAGLARAEPQVLIDTDFGATGRAFQEINPAKGIRITGSLPPDWGDNSNWKSNVVAEYGPAQEGDHRFLRARQSSGDGMQFTHLLPGMAKEAGYYRLSFTVRSQTGLSLAVRDNGVPYRAWATFTPATDGQWRDFSYDFRLARARQEIGLFIYMAGNGTLDLQKLKLIKLSEQDLIAEIKAKYPEAGSGNLVNASVFPLGLPSGWSIDRDYSDGDEVQVASDAKVPGPSGCSALMIEAAKKGIRLYSAPFAVPWSFETHVLSLSVRGDWEGALIVTGGDRPCARLPLKLSGDRWQRVELPFKPVLLAPSHALRLEGKGTLWLDGLQVEHAAHARAYSPPKPMEIALALPDSEAASARVQFADESPQVAFAVAGKMPGAVLKTRLVTMYADEKLLPPIKLDGAISGRIAYEPFTPHGLGPYRLEAWVEDTAGQRVSPYSELVFYRLRRPRYWGKDAPNSFFGAHTLSTNRHLTMAKTAGVNWVRLHDAGTEYIGWAHLEPEKGQWQFRDADLQRYRAHHLKILGLLSTTPGWASSLGRPTRGYRERYLEPLHMDDWANAVRTIVSHHRGLIDTYEIWNEPWGSGFWGVKLDPQPGRDELLRGDTPAQDYARLQKVAYDAAHEVFPAVTILGFNTCDSETGTKWTKDVLDFSGIDTCDAVSYHHYETGLTGFPHDPVEKAYRAALGPIIEKLGRMPKPVWMSEGAPLSGDVSNGFYRYTLPYENRNDNWRIADRLARYVIAHQANREAHEFLYTMHGHSTFGGSVEWTTLVTAEGFLHPSAAAHSALAWLLEDTHFVRRVTLADGVYAYLNAGPDRAVAAITSAPTHGPYQMPTAADVRLLDLFGNPLPAGAALDDHVHYVECDTGLARLQAVLGVSDVFGKSLSLDTVSTVPSNRKKDAAPVPTQVRLEYDNPVWDGYLADPQVLKTGGEYYAYGTGPARKGRQFPLLHSKDFAHWEFLGNALETLADPKVKAYWAPEVAEKDGKFYLYYAGEYRMRVAVADHPAGPFQDAGRILFPDEPFSIDGHPYHDPSRGKWYLFFAKDFLDQRVGTALAVAELSDDMISVTGPVKTVLRAVGDWQIYERHRTMYGRVFDAWHTVEAPFVVLREGRYYCFYSGGNWQTPGYGVGFAIADQVMGPYKDDADLEGATVLKSIPGKLIGPGHNSVVLGPDDQTHFIVYHSWNPERTKRQMCLDPIEWTPQGPRADNPARGKRVIILPRRTGAID